MTAPRKAKLVAPRAPVTINAAAGDDDGPRGFEAVAYSGGIIPGYTCDPKLDLDYVIDLAGMEVGRNPLVNLSHDEDKRVGHIPQVFNDGRVLGVKGLLSAATTHRDEVENSAKAGYPWEGSMEANLANIGTLASGKTETVNGQTVTGPLYIARKSKFTGLAFVGRGADEGNTVCVAATAAEELTMSEFDKWLVDNEFDPEAMSVKQKATMQAAFDARKADGVKIGANGSLSAIAKAERDENERVDTITMTARQAMKDTPQWIDAIAEMADKAIKEKQSVDHFELELLRGTRHSTGVFKVAANRQEPDAKVIEAALCRAVGLPDYEKHFTEKVLDAVDTSGLKNFSLQAMLLRAACANGYDVSPGERITAGNIKRVLKRAFPDDDAVVMRGAQFSTVSLPGIFSNVANKEILAGFTEEDNTWREISRIATATDFKATTAYRLTDSLEYEELPKGGEIKHGTLGEESYTRQIKTYAKMLGLDRQDIINDDLSAFDELRTRLGRGAARKFNNVFWTAFMANSSFFTTARGNYIEGATTNLGTDGVGLTAGVKKFRQLESADGKRIGGTPQILMVPPELEFIADQLFSGGSPESQTAANTNPFRGKYRTVVVPWLSDTDFTGNSTTAWYLFRNPGILAPMVVSFLNGNQSPTVESTDADFNTLGILFRGFHDFAADQAEYLAGIKSLGAAP
jgi:hypothetical protein